MSLRTYIATINTLDADQSVASSVTPVDITGFGFLARAGKMIAWRVSAVFTLGATGGFRFLAHNTSAPTRYNARFQVVDLTTPATYNAGMSAEAAVTNASAVAGTYVVEANGLVLANANTTFSFQFAQNNSTVNEITILAGARFELQQIN